MDDNLNKQIEIQNKISNLVRERQAQITDLKNYYDVNKKILYKDIILISPNLVYLEDVLSKSNYRLKAENMMSLSLSLGKVIDLNNSVKSVLLALKIFEEHETYVKNNAPSMNHNKSFIYKMFEKNETVPLIKNNFLKNKFLEGKKDEKETNNLKEFYSSLYRQDGNFWTDFNKYLNFQMDPKGKNKDNNFKLDDFASKLYKLYQGSSVNYFKFYTRCQIVIYILTLVF